MKKAAKKQAKKAAVELVVLDTVRAAIVGCERCERLQDYIRGIGEKKRRMYRDQEYWAKPVPGFGDPAARILALGLAPGAHGANRTGRPFTGDASVTLCMTCCMSWVWRASLARSAATTDCG